MNSFQDDDFLLDNEQEYHEYAMGVHDVSHIKHKISFQKERTSEESYQEIMKMVHLANLERIQLQKQYQRIKKSTCDKYLAQFYEELDELNMQNKQLRQQLKQCKRVKDDHSERLSHRSSIKMRTSVRSINQTQNQKTNTKNKSRKASPNMLLKRKQAKLTESTTNLGRRQVQSPSYHCRKDSLLTQRKRQVTSYGQQIANGVNLAQQFDLKGSVSKCNLKYVEQSKNVFVQLLEQMLFEQKVYEDEQYGQLQNQIGLPAFTKAGHAEVRYINDLQQEIKQSQGKLQLLGVFLNKYQQEIESMSSNLKGVTECTSRLMEVKGRFIQMEKKCEKLHFLSEQVKIKEQKLNQGKASSTQAETTQKHISSIESMLKIVTNNPNKTFKAKSTDLYYLYCRQIKQTFRNQKEDQAKRFQKVGKVKETIDSIKETRKKFNELIVIYEQRIGKLQVKLQRMRQKGESAARKREKDN